MRQFLKTGFLIAVMTSLAACGGAQQAGAETEAEAKTAVSYTHLTLPTTPYV